MNNQNIEQSKIAGQLASEKLGGMFRAEDGYIVQCVFSYEKLTVQDKPEEKKLQTRLTDDFNEFFDDFMGYPLHKLCFVGISKEAEQKLKGTFGNGVSVVNIAYGENEAPYMLIVLKKMDFNREKADEGMIVELLKQGHVIEVNQETFGKIRNLEGQTYIKDNGETGTISLRRVILRPRIKNVYILK